jgi:splicing factor 3A subunit 1
MAAGLPTPGGGTAYSGTTISAAPTGPTQKEYITYETPSAPSIHPSRMAQMGAGTPPVAGQPHARDEEEPAERPLFKRPKIEKRPYGQLYSVRLF